MNRVPNAQIRELCGVKEGLDERNNEGVLRWFGHVERMERDKIAMKVYAGECVLAVVQWVMKEMECLKKRGLDISQTGRMVQNRSEWHWFVRRDEPLTLMRCHRYIKPLKYGSPSVAEPTT